MIMIDERRIISHIFTEILSYVEDHEMLGDIDTHPKIQLPIGEFAYNTATLCIMILDFLGTNVATCNMRRAVPRSIAQF